MTQRIDTDETEQLDTPRSGQPAHVNLLPREYLVEYRRRRVAVVALGILAAYVVALGVVYSFKQTKVDEARAERDVVAQQVTVLQAEVDSLAEYQQLLTAIGNREALLTAAMDDQLSWARILGDLAFAFSRQASLTEMAAVATAVDEAQLPAPDAEVDAAEPDPTDPVAQVVFTGYSVDRFAPGVAEVLANFEDTDGFMDSYLAIASDEERGGSEVTTFEGRVDLDGGAVTHRFDDGLPEESLE